MQPLMRSVIQRRRYPIIVRQRLYRQRRLPFRAIIHQHIGTDVLRNACFTLPICLRISGNSPIVVRHGPLLRFLIGHLRPCRGAEADQGREVE